MSKRQFVTQWTYVHKFDEHADPISLAVPGEAYTIQELLTKFSKGLMPELNTNNPDYDGEEADIDIDQDISTRSISFDHSDAMILRDIIHERRNAPKDVTQTKEPSDITEPKTVAPVATEGGTTEGEKEPQVNGEGRAGSRISTVGESKK